MPTPVRLVLAGALLLAAGVLLTIAVLGALGRLRRNPWAGVRTRGTLASDEAFTVANRVAAAPLGAAGIVAPADRTSELALVGTHMRGLDPAIARRLVNWGYAISDAAIRSYMKDVPLDAATLPYPAEGI